MITPFTMCLTRTQSAQDQACGVCGAEFVPAEDSGSRQLSLMPADKEPFSVLMCGGCHSKWSHGVTVTVRRGGETSVAPVLRHPERAERRTNPPADSNVPVDTPASVPSDGRLRRVSNVDDDGFVRALRDELDRAWTHY